MDYIIEILMEIALEFFEGLTKNKKAPKFLRYLSFCIIAVFFTAIVMTILVLVVLMLEDSRWIGLIFIGLAVIMAIGAILFCQKLKRGLKNQNNTL